MFEDTYNRVVKKPITRQGLLSKDSETLKSLLDDGVRCTSKKAIAAFIEDLRILLKENSVVKLIEKIHELENNIKKVSEAYNIDFLSLDDFYKDLSPLLLQKYWENSKNPVLKEDSEDLFLSTIHIAIEEEIYIWQEKI